jgi:BTB/POZ domain
MKSTPHNTANRRNTFPRPPVTSNDASAASTAVAFGNRNSTLSTLKARATSTEHGNDYFSSGSSSGHNMSTMTTTTATTTVLQPLQNRLWAVLNNKKEEDTPKMADVYLVGDDGIAVPALKCILSCTSPVFDRMLFGTFKESQQPGIKIPIQGVNSNVLQYLIEYCCSDQLGSLGDNHHLLKKQEDKQGDFSNASSLDSSSESLLAKRQQVIDAVSLAELGDKYQIPGLEAAIVPFVKQWMQEDPSLACLVFDGSRSETTPLIRAAAWKIIVKRPNEALLQLSSSIISSTQATRMRTKTALTPVDTSCCCEYRGGIQALSAERLLELYEHATQIRATPLFLFQRLLEWYHYHTDNATDNQQNGTSSENNNKDCNGDDNDDSTTACAVCQECSRHLTLSAIDPVALKTIVRPAPFMDPQVLLEAFMEQALLAHHLGLDFAQTHYQPGEPPRSRRVLVQGAGVDGINGVYVQDEPPITVLIQQQFTKRNVVSGDQPVFLVQGREDGLWFICDPAQYYYHCKSPADVLPSTGWKVVSSQIDGNGMGIAPAPTCKFFFYLDDDDDDGKD